MSTTTYSTVDDSQIYGTWTDTAAGISICLAVPLMVLFYAHRDLFPIAQREPIFVLVANFSFQFTNWMYLFERMHPELQLWGTKIYTQLGWGIMVCLYFVRAWKLYIETGLASERVQGKAGWFIMHRHYRSRRFLAKIIIGLVTVHIIMVPVEFILVPQNFIPSRTLINGSAGPLLFALLILLYFVSYGVLGCKLRNMRDGFYIKTELALVGCDCFIILAWMFVQITQVQCVSGFPSCQISMLWLSSVWMFAWSVAFPVAIASRDPRFSLLRCFRFKKMKPRSSSDVTSRASTTEGSKGSKESSQQRDDDSHHSGQPEYVVRASGAVDEKLRKVPLVTFLACKPAREAFRKFTVLEWSIENLLFVEAVEELAGRPHTTAEVRVVWEQYVTENAPNQVNLPALIRDRARARLTEDCTVTVFEEAVQHTYKLMSRDTYKRFQRTAEWERCVKEYDIKAKDGAGNPTTSSVCDTPKVAITFGSPSSPEPQSHSAPASESQSSAPRTSNAAAPRTSNASQPAPAPRTSNASQPAPRTSNPPPPTESSYPATSSPAPEQPSQPPQTPSDRNETPASPAVEVQLGGQTMSVAFE